MFDESLVESLRDFDGEDVVHVVIGTLACHLPVATAEALAAVLPDELRDLVLATADGTGPFEEHAFLEDLAETLEADTEETERLLVNVLSAIRHALEDSHLAEAFVTSLPRPLQRRL